jgi:hypothetical protein
MRARSQIAAILLLTLTCVLFGGCQRVMFPSNKPRNQFETWDRMRTQYIPLEEPDAFGNPQPALRARLGQRY